MLIDYNGQDIDNAIVRFTADWCQPCKAYRPIFDKVAELLDADFFVVDIDKYPDIAREHNVMSIPAVFSVKGGVWERFEHVPAAAELKDAVDNL
jgi:thiol-disulfide isomerase/thioredoxin